MIAKKQTKVRTIALGALWYCKKYSRLELKGNHFPKSEVFGELQSEQQQQWKKIGWRANSGDTEELVPTKDDVDSNDV